MNKKLWIASLFVASLAMIVLIPTSPVAVAEEDSIDAKALYEKKCGMCHGKDGVAKKMAAGSANLNDPEWQKSTTLEEIVKLTAEGKGKMPKSEGKLTPEEIEAVSKYVLTLK